MKIENQVCSLKLARRLKELGVKQESVWIWGIGGDKCERKWTLLLDDDESWSAKEIVCAFSVAELGKMLPDRIDNVNSFKIDFCCNPATKTEKKEWIVCYLPISAMVSSLAFIKAKTEANARAKMLVYLIENKLVEL